MNDSEDDPNVDFFTEPPSFLKGSDDINSLYKKSADVQLKSSGRQFQTTSSIPEQKPYPREKSTLTVTDTSAIYNHLMLSGK
jgi:hypothetical protein